MAVGRRSQIKAPTVPYPYTAEGLYIRIRLYIEYIPYIYSYTDRLYSWYYDAADPCFLRGIIGAFTSNSPLLIHTFESSACVTVSAFSELLKSLQICLDCENVRSTETLVAGIARKSLAIRATIAKLPSCI